MNECLNERLYNPLYKLPQDLESYIFKFIDKSINNYNQYIKAYYKKIYNRSLKFFDKRSLCIYLFSKFTMAYNPFSIAYDFGHSFNFGLDKRGNVIPGSGREKHKIFLSFIVSNGNFRIRKLPPNLLNKFNSRQKNIYKLFMITLDIF